MGKGQGKGKGKEEGEGEREWEREREKDRERGIPVLCLQKRSPENQKYRAERSPFFFYFLESKRVSVLCRNVDQDFVHLWSLLGHFGGLFEAFWAFLVMFGGPRPRCSKFGGLERN